MSIFEFVAIIQLSGLLSANVGLTEHVVKIAFVHSRMTTIDELDQSGASMLLSQVEYFEAVRVSLVVCRARPVCLPVRALCPSASTHGSLGGMTAFRDSTWCCVG